MKLNVKDSGQLSESLGISEQRKKQLVDGMNLILENFVKQVIIGNTGKRFSVITAEIAEICYTLEEYTFCLVAHINWWQERGVKFQ